LLHVLDASDAAVENCYKTTVSVLQELGAGEIPVITVLNKVDKLEDSAQIPALLAQFPESVAVWEKKGSGLDELKSHIAQKLKRT
jgi:GTP-binding protein HflX